MSEAYLLTFFLRKMPNLSLLLMACISSHCKSVWIKVSAELLKLEIVKAMTTLGIRKVLLRPCAPGEAIGEFGYPSQGLFLSFDFGPCPGTIPHPRSSWGISSGTQTPGSSGGPAWDSGPCPGPLYPVLGLRAPSRNSGYCPGTFPHPRSSWVPF